MMTLPDGRSVAAPAGFTAQQVKLAQNAMQKRNARRDADR